MPSSAEESSKPQPKKERDNTDALFAHCPECGGTITIQNPEAYILSIHLEEYCPSTGGWLHAGE